MGKRGIAHRGYVTAKDRERSLGSRDDAKDDGCLVSGLVKKERAERLLLKLEELMADPAFIYEPPWLGEVTQKLRAGTPDRLCYLLVGRLECAIRMAGMFIGPIQRKPKAQREVTRQWYANREALETMQAKRPLKPPGR